MDVAFTGAGVKITDYLYGKRFDVEFSGSVDATIPNEAILIERLSDVRFKSLAVILNNGRTDIVRRLLKVIAAWNGNAHGIVDVLVHVAASIPPAETKQMAIVSEMMDLVEIQARPLLRSFPPSTDRERRLRRLRGDLGRDLGYSGIGYIVREEEGGVVKGAELGEWELELMESELSPDEESEAYERRLDLFEFVTSGGMARHVRTFRPLLK